MSGTEERNIKSMHLDKMSTEEIISLIQEENYNAVKSLDKELENITIACDAIINGMENGGRLIYVGAGTSGRLGVVDASECPPTYGVSQDLVIGIIAGGKDKMFVSSEGAEDNYEAGKEDLEKYNLNKNDVVVGISAAGNAAYIVAAIEYAKKIGCKTVGLACNSNCELVKKADISIVTETGAEVVTGSTRMKAGTAQKLVLNMLSTTAMIRTGKVYENLMINLKPSNVKLRKRMINIVCEILKCDEHESETLLQENDWNIKKIVEKIKK